MPSIRADFILGEWVMRTGDRLPLLGLVLESDAGKPLNLTGASCTLLLRHQDGGDALTVPHPGIPTRNGWLVLPAFVYDPPNGVVVYDWPQAETSSLRVGVLEMMVEAVLANGDLVTVPTARDARLVVRPSAWPSATPAPDWIDTAFVEINAGDDYSTLGVWNTSVPGEVHGP